MTADRHRLRLRHGERELEIESSDLTFIESKLDEFWRAGEAARTAATSGRDGSAELRPSRPLGLVEHVRRIGAKSGTEMVVAVGSYLEEQRGLSGGFKTRDVAEAFKEARFHHSNPSEAVRQAKAAGWLMAGDERQAHRLTQTALDWVQERAAS